MRLGKLCSKCCKVKALSSFTEQKASPDGKDYWCRLCRAEYRQAYYTKNKASENALASEWKRQNSLYLSSYNRQYHEDRYQSDPVYRQHKIDLMVEWQRRNPEYQRSQKARRRAIMRDSGGVVTRSEICSMMEEQRGKCFYCPASLTNSYHLEHKTPLVRGGTNQRKNVCLSCPTCNLRKGQKTSQEFLSVLRYKSVPRLCAMGGVASGGW